MATREEEQFLGGYVPFQRRGKPFGNASQGKEAAARSNTNNQNRINRVGLVGAAKDFGGDLLSLGGNINKKVITPAANKGSNLLFGDGKNTVNLADPQHARIGDNPMSYNALGSGLPANNTNKFQPPALGGNIQNQPASTEAPGSYQTDKYRDASIYTDNTPNLEGDTLGVTFGGGKGSVSGLTPEQAQRIQASLANGDQVTGWEPGALAQAEHSSGNASIMSALQSGQIGAEKASALMSRDFRGSDRMDRLGGNAGTYVPRDSAPTNINEAMAFGSKLSNFTNNGELSGRPTFDDEGNVTPPNALLAQRGYQNSLGGYKGVANAERPEFKSISQDIFDNQGQGMKVGQDLFSFNPETGKYTPFNQLQNDQRGSTEALMEKYNNSGGNKRIQELVKKSYEEINGEGSFDKYLKSIK